MTIFTKARVGTTFLEEVDAPLGDMLRATFEEALNTNPAAALMRERELREAWEGPLLSGGMGLSMGLATPTQPEVRGQPDSPVISAADARQRVEESGLQLTIPDEGIPERALEILMERKRAERLRQDAYTRGPTGFVPGALRLGVSLGASLLDPLNVASAFIPVVGPARYAAMLARAGSIGGRAGVRLGVGAVEGTVGAALVEPIVLNAMRYEQADYDLVDSLLNVALGGVLGGGLHVVGGTALDIMQGRRAATAPPPSAIQRGIESAAPETREALLRTSVAQLVEGRNVSVESVAFLDPVVRAAKDAPETFSSAVGWRARMEMEDEARLIGEANVRSFRTALGSTYEVHPDGTTTRTKAARDAAGHEGDSGLKPRTQKTVYTDVNASPLSAAGLTGVGPRGARVAIKDGRATLLMWNEKAGRWGASPEGRDIPIFDTPAVGRYPLELWRKKDDIPGYEAYSGMHAGNAITEIGGAAPVARAPSGPVDQRAWANVVSDAQTGGLQLSSLADVGASRQADELLKTSTKADTPEGLEQEAADAFESVKELGEALGATQTLDALSREADSITQEAESLGKAARALALCQLRRGPK